MREASALGGLAGAELRDLVPQVLGALVRRYGRFDSCEDAVQEALLAATRQWPVDGVPDNPRAWLITVASRRLTDQLRSESASRRREELLAARAPSDALVVAGIDDPALAADGLRSDGDDSLTLLFLCCHPSLSPQSRVALTLRAVGGLTTVEIASAFFVPEATMAQRISRAKQRIRETAAPFELPPAGERAERLQAVLRVLYLVFNEGYTASGGDDLQRPELAAEAIRLARQLTRSLPDDGEVTGLLALMLLTDARRAARTSADGGLVPLGEQDRDKWDHDEIAEGVALVTAALASGPVGPYQLEAAIAAVHDEAPSTEATDWPQVLALYDLLRRIEPGPMVTLNRAIAVAMVRGPTQGLQELTALDDDERVAGHHRLIATRAHLLEMAGDEDGARDAFLRASSRTASAPEQRYLAARARRLSPGSLRVEH